MTVLTQQICRLKLMNNTSRYCILKIDNYIRSLDLKSSATSHVSWSTEHLLSVESTKK